MSVQSNNMARLSPQMYFYMIILYEKFFIRKKLILKCVCYFTCIYLFVDKYKQLHTRSTIVRFCLQVWLYSIGDNIGMLVTPLLG